MRCFVSWLLSAALLLGGCSKSKSSTYEVGIDPTWYPLQVPGQEKNILAFSTELLTEIAKREKLELATVDMSWDNLLWGLREKKYQGILTTLRPYAFYTEKLDFSPLYLPAGPVLVTPLGSDGNIRGKIVGVVYGSSAALALQKVPGIVLEKYDTMSAALQAVAQGRVSASAIPLLLAQDYIKNIYPSELKIASEPLTNEGLRLVTLKDISLVSRFTSGLKGLMKESRYAALLEKWDLD